MTRKQAFEHGKKQLQKPEERDCEHCIHHKDNGCESWECHFERRTADIELIVKIDADVYARLFDNGVQDNEIATDDICEMARALRLGKPLPEHHEMLIDTTNLITKIQLATGCSFLTAQEIINKSVVIVPATEEEKNCDTCQFDGMCPSNVRLLVKHNGCTTWTPKQTATKEGE